MLTEEPKQDVYPPATMETVQAATEEALYTNLPETRADKPSGYPADEEETGTNDKVAKVKADAGSQKIGPSITLKVMSGDRFNIRVSSWYSLNATTPDNPISPLTDLVAALISGVGGAAASTHGAGIASELQTSGVLIPQATDFLNSQTYNSNKPKAYINWILFDEQFTYYDGDFEQVGDNEELKKHTKTNLSVGKNGYLYVYVSNETPNISVFFDNLRVTHDRGPILEETHYYPFGLTMAGISSKALNNAIENKYRFNAGNELQNKEFSDGSGLEWYATQFRMLDPQIGRWWQIDPKPDYGQSPYSSMSNNPIRFNDPLGDTVRVDNSITDNKLLNSSFNAYARTKAGRKFLANYAAKGQIIGGHTFKEDGKYSKQGVDLNYNAQSFDKDKGGETSKSVDASGRGQITVSVNSNFYEKTVNGLVGEAVGKIGTFFHESFIHADLHTKDFLDNKKFDYSNISSSVKNAVDDSRNYHHYKVLQDFVNKGYNSGNLWPLNAFNGMKEINDALKVYKSDQEMLNEMWNYNGGIVLDEAGNKKQ